MAGWHEPRAERFKRRIHTPDVMLELQGRLCRPYQGRNRLGGFQLDDVGDQLVRPGNIVLLDVRCNFARYGAKQIIDHRPYVKRLGIDDHVLQLDAESLEEMQGRVGH